jgi:hypothetical protein
MPLLLVLVLAVLLLLLLFSPLGITSWSPSNRSNPRFSAARIAASLLDKIAASSSRRNASS